jgi:CubicO group peptidase (beta-lactamase class C family)
MNAKTSCRLLVASALLLAAPVAWPQARPASAAASAVTLSADTAQVTPLGNTFVAPAGWKLSRSPDVVKLEAPEGGSWLALVDVEAADAAGAVAEAWRRAAPGFRRTLRVAADGTNRDTWTGRRTFDYETSPNEHRSVYADARRANGAWTVVLADLAQDVEEKRDSQVGLVMGKLLPKGYTRETFAGRKAHPLDAARVAALREFVTQSMKETGVPGVSFGLVQGGRVVWAGGVGVRELGKPALVDADTRFMVASNTKALVTLMLARLVDEGKLRWDDPVIKVWPAFRLGSADTTRQVLVKHLICACTGMPRQDMEWLLEYAPMTPQKVMDLLATMQPTSGFGELFQYSNTMASAAGYLGGHLVYPDKDLGAAYDATMQRLVFDPLGMRDTTQDFDAGERGNAAVPHAPDIDNRIVLALASVNRSAVPMRPAAGVWSTTDDMLKYVALELAGGRLPNGQQLLSRDVLLARRAPQVAVSDGVTYGMGLEVDTVYGTPVVHHGGDMIGFHSDMMWLPEHDVGAVVLTNGDPGWLIRTVFRRKLLEVLFDGRPEADAAIAAQSKAFFDDRVGTRKLLKVPADPQAAALLAAHYRNAAIGDVTVRRQGSATIFDFGEWSSEVASKANPDGTTSMYTTASGLDGVEFVMGRDGDKRTLTLRDGQHAYVMVEGQP